MIRHMCILLLITIWTETNVFAHGQNVHQYFVMEGYRLLQMQTGGIPSMEQRIGTMDSWYAGDYIFQRGYVTTGAWREDEEDPVYGYRHWSQSWLPPPFDEQWDRAYISITHFWNADNGDQQNNDMQATIGGITINVGSTPNAYQKMQYYGYGGWVVSFPFDLRVQKPNGDWLDLTAFSSYPSLSYYGLADLWKTGRMHTELIGAYLMINERTQELEWYVGDVTLEPALREAVVWEILGRMCHLLGDMSVPAHAHNKPHPEGDAYEDWVGDDWGGSAYRYWSADNVGPLLNPYAINADEPLHGLMYVVQEATAHFSTSGISGEDGIGGQYASGEWSYLSSMQLSSLGLPISANSSFTLPEKSNICDKTEPLVIRAIGGLLYWFATESGLWPPTNMLLVPEMYPTISTALAAATSGQTVYVSGSQTVDSYVTVNSGITLKFSAGSSILFNSSSTRLLVFGSLMVAGTSSLHVLFDGQGFYRSGIVWPLILVASGGTANIQHADFKNAAYELALWTSSGASSVGHCTFTTFGVDADSKALTIYYTAGPVAVSNNTFTGSNSTGTAVYAYNTGTNVRIDSNSISSTGIGIRSYSSNAKMKGNSIHGISSCGIQCDNVQSGAIYERLDIRSSSVGLSLNSSSPWIDHSVFVLNGLNVLVNGGSPQFGVAGGDLRGYNTIAYAASPLLRVQNYAFAYLGYDFDGGYNSLYETDLPHISVTNNSGVWADNNFWQEGPSYYADGTSWATTRTPLAGNPNPNPLPKNAVVASNFVGTIADTSGEGAFRFAVRTAMIGDPASARSDLEGLIFSRSPKFAPLALLTYYDLSNGRWGSAGAGVRTSLFELLTNLSTQSSGSLLRPFALRLLACDAAATRSDSTANLYRLQILRDYPNSAHELATMYDIIVSTIHVENDLRKAKVLLGRMKTLYPRDLLTYMAAAEVGEQVDFWALEKQQSAGTQMRPVKVDLSPAYPNPFNPSTTIEYALPDAGEVSLIVYDVLGREVASLANGLQEAGYHSVVWNATALASGVYFARFIVKNESGATKFNKVNKLLLMK